MKAQLFAATPPLEGLKCLLSRAMGRRMSRRGKRLKIAFIDIKKAHLFAKTTRKIFIELRWEDQAPGMVGELVYCLYGTRDAAANFEATYTAVLVAARFTQGVSNPCFFRHDDLDIEVLVHGDDFVVLADDDGVDSIVKVS